MAALFDTSVVVLLLRRRPPAGTEGVLQAARTEISAGGALLSAVAATELLVGETSAAGSERLGDRLSRIPTAVLPDEAARFAGTMGAFLAGRGAPLPLPDLLIAATAVWLQVPLLAWDSDYPRSRDLALTCASDHPGAALWRELALHPASLA